MNHANVANRQGTYVVTYDVASRLQSFRSRKIKVPSSDDPLFADFHRGLREKLQYALPGAVIDTISMSELRLEIWNQVEGRINDLRKQAVLSTCPEIADSNPKSEGLLLNINRLFNTRGDIIGYGPRPGFKSLDKQLDELARRIAGRSVVLIEDGAFTGGTLSNVISELKNRGITVTAVVIGFCCNGSRKVLRNAFEGELVMVHPVVDLIDWIPDHDLIPFIPNCGRVLGEQTDHYIKPMKTISGVSCAFPYILPFGKIEEWASLPIEDARDISGFCLDVSVELFSRIGKLNGHEVTIGEVLGGNSRLSMPVLVGDHESIPTPDTEVVAFLQKMRKKLEM